MQSSPRRPVEVSEEDATDCAIALIRYLDWWRQHQQADAGLTHTEEEWNRVRLRVGRLIWQMEEAAFPTGTNVQHHDYAVPPSAG